jgi:hypothetical protein
VAPISKTMTASPTCCPWSLSFPSDPPGSSTSCNVYICSSKLGKNFQTPHSSRGISLWLQMFPFSFSGTL